MFCLRGCLTDVLSKENVGVNVTLTMVSIGVAESISQFILDVVYVLCGMVRCIVMSFMKNSVGVLMCSVQVMLGFLVLVSDMLHGCEVAVMVSEATAVARIRVRGGK